MNTVPHYVPDGNYTIYRLRDPRDNASRYIGITINLFERFKQHIRCDGCNPLKDEWMVELQIAQLMPIMESIERVETLSHALEREKYWMQRDIEQGAKLLNIAGITPAPSVKPKPVVRARLVRNIPIHVEPWVIVDYPIGKRNNQLVTVEYSTPEEFQAWLDWNNVDESITEELDSEYARKGLGWTFEYRYLVINHALNQGISLELADGLVVEPFSYKNGIVVTYHGKG